jgi:HD-GYP domain-containing protein (c-di-GMP phosphodiesterase class II)
MTDHLEKITTDQLALGMFIDELDRPWLESPFLLQGFILENDKQISVLKNLCSHVYIDRSKSLDDQFKAKPKLKVAIKREGSIVKIYNTEPIKKSKDIAKATAPKVVVRTHKNQNKTIQQASFFEVISAIKNGTVSHSKDGIIFNMRSEEGNPNPRPATEQVIIYGEKQAGFLSGLLNKTKSSKEDNPLEGENSETYRVTIYEDIAPPVEQEIAVIYPTYEKSQLATKELFEAIADENNLDISTVSEVLDTMIESITRSPDALMWLAKLKAADDIAYGQALNVSINMMAFASFLAFPKQEIKEMGLAGLLQDIGKIRIPPRILHKKTKLSNVEFEMVKLHLDETLRILNNTQDISPLIVSIIAQHHERINGKGYPNKLMGETISLTSQIAGLIDTYCAITTERCYAPKLTNLNALDEIHSLRGLDFSNEVVDQLIQFFGIYPVSTLVELNTGEVAVVIQQNQVRRLQPRVMVILAADKTPNAYPATLDLLHAPTTPKGEQYKIVKGIPPDSYGINLNDFYI